MGTQRIEWVIGGRLATFNSKSLNNWRGRKPAPSARPDGVVSCIGFLADLTVVQPKDVQKLRPEPMEAVPSKSGQALQKLRHTPTRGRRWSACLANAQQVEMAGGTPLAWMRRVT